MTKMALALVMAMAMAMALGLGMDNYNSGFDGIKHGFGVASGHGFSLGFGEGFDDSCISTFRYCYGNAYGACGYDFDLDDGLDDNSEIFVDNGYGISIGEGFGDGYGNGDNYGAC